LVKGAPSFLYLAECACARPVRAGVRHTSSHLSPFSLAAKTVGCRRHRVMQGREVGGVEVGHVRLEGEESMWAGFSQAMVR
jgi:hypothetical protein